MLRRLQRHRGLSRDGAHDQGGHEFDPAALERTEARFWRDLGAPRPRSRSSTGASAEFGPMQATVPAPRGRALNLLLGAAEPAPPRGVPRRGDRVGRDRAHWLRLLPRSPARGRRALLAAGFERGAWTLRPRRPPAPLPGAAGSRSSRRRLAADAPSGRSPRSAFGLPAWTASLFAALPGLPDWRCYADAATGAPRPPPRPSSTAPVAAAGDRRDRRGRPASALASGAPAPRDRGRRGGRRATSSSRPDRRRRPTALDQRPPASSSPASRRPTSATAGCDARLPAS